jgi:hypothetical protein
VTHNQAFYRAGTALIASRKVGQNKKWTFAWFSCLIKQCNRKFFLKLKTESGAGKGCKKDNWRCSSSSDHSTFCRNEIRALLFTAHPMAD